MKTWHAGPINGCPQCLAEERADSASWVESMIRQDLVARGDSHSLSNPYSIFGNIFDEAAKRIAAARRSPTPCPMIAKLDAWSGDASRAEGNYWVRFRESASTPGWIIMWWWPYKRVWLSPGTLGCRYRSAELIIDERRILPPE